MKKKSNNNAAQTAANKVFDCGSMIIKIETLSDIDREERANKICKFLEPKLEALDKAGCDFNLLANYNDFTEFVKDNDFTKEMASELYLIAITTSRLFKVLVDKIIIVLKTPKAGIKMIWPIDRLIMTSKCYDSLTEKDIDLFSIGTSDEGDFFETTGKKPQIIRAVDSEELGMFFRFLCEASELYGDPRIPDWLLGIIHYNLEDDEK